jgi:hypothetical protein
VISKATLSDIFRKTSIPLYNREKELCGTLEVTTCDLQAQPKPHKEEDTFVVERATDLAENDKSFEGDEGAAEVSEEVPTQKHKKKKMNKEEFPVHKSKLDTQWKVGDKVMTRGGKKGVIGYIGDVKFSDGPWVGLTLSTASKHHQFASVFSCQI